MRLLIYGDIGGSGGYIRYCKGLLGSRSIPEDIEVWFISSLSFYKDLVPLDPGIHIITHPWIISRNRFFRYLWYLWVYPQLVRKIKPDAEFYPSGKLRVYLRKACAISTCHNLLLFDRKELDNVKSKKEKRYFQRARKDYAKSFQKSDALIFLSNHSKKWVCNEISGIKQTTVIAHGLDPAFLLRQKRSYELGERINILYVSPIYSYKHHIEVVQAVKILRESSGFDICLKLVGEGDSSVATNLKQFVHFENVCEFISITGPTDYTFLPKEYISADIFVFASSCETFGITILEAMGSRLPIACSNRTGLNEILKDAGIYFNPEDPEIIARALQKLLYDIHLRETLGERAYKYALEYTWKDSALETFNYLKKVGRTSLHK